MNHDSSSEFKLSCFLAPAELPSFVIPAFSVPSKLNRRTRVRDFEHSLFIQDVRNDDHKEFVRVEVSDETQMLPLGAVSFWAESKTIDAPKVTEQVSASLKNREKLYSYAATSGAVLLGPKRGLARALQESETPCVNISALPPFAMLEVVRFIRSTGTSETNFDAKVPSLENALQRCRDFLSAIDATMAEQWFALASPKLESRKSASESRRELDDGPTL